MKFKVTYLGLIEKGLLGPKELQVDASTKEEAQDIFEIVCPNYLVIQIEAI